MFTNDNSRNRNVAAAAIFAAAIIALPTQGFSAPKRDVGHGKWNQVDAQEARYGHPSNRPAGTGDATIHVDAMNKRDMTVTPEPFLLNLVRFNHPSNPPSGSGDTTIRTDAMKKKDTTFAKEPKASTEGRQAHPSNPPAGSGDTTIVTSAIRTDSGAALAGSSTTRTASPAFIRSLDLSSGGRWVDGAASYAPARNPFTDGRAWVSLTRDGGNGVAASAGMSFLLK